MVEIIEDKGETLVVEAKSLRNFVDEFIELQKKHIGLLEECNS